MVEAGLSRDEAIDTVEAAQSAVVAGHLMEATMLEMLSLGNYRMDVIVQVWPHSDHVEDELCLVVVPFLQKFQPRIKPCCHSLNHDKAKTASFQCHDVLIRFAKKICLFNMLNNRIF